MHFLAETGKQALLVDMIDEVRFSIEPEPFLDVI